ncbi:MAG: radical SAM protein [Candidatus Lernaella stagnicola]|nr:radical SAM protein [Candidatus Lernaella stagnicola]
MSYLSCHDGVTVRQVGEVFLASKPEIGAFSVLREEELLPFAIFQQCNNNFDELSSHYLRAGMPDSHEIAQGFMDMLAQDGWLRRSYSLNDGSPLETVYFTITKRCNLFCPYCYLGRNHNEQQFMSLAEADNYLTLIQAENPNSHIIITGGEPLIHRNFLSIVTLIGQKDLRCAVLTNGTLLTKEMASRLSTCEHISYIQISLDGITQDVHNRTRAGSFERTMHGINNAIAAGLPFTLAPTIHSGNLHQQVEIARFAVRNGGYYTPNNFRDFPHATPAGLSLTGASLYSTIRDVSNHLREEFGLETLMRIEKNTSLRLNNPVPDRDKSVCGIGHMVIDINWNGDVYPCNLLRESNFLLGNLRVNAFSDIWDRVNDLGIRTRAFDIQKCSSCEVISQCAGGCRAAAYYAYGSFNREDDLCDSLHASHVDKQIRSRQSSD